MGQVLWRINGFLSRLRFEMLRTIRQWLQLEGDPSPFNSESNYSNYKLSRLTRHQPFIQARMTYRPLWNFIIILNPCGKIILIQLRRQRRSLRTGRHLTLKHASTWALVIEWSINTPHFNPFSSFWCIPSTWNLCSLPSSLSKVSDSASKRFRVLRHNQNLYTVRSSLHNWIQTEWIGVIQVVPMYVSFFPSFIILIVLGLYWNLIILTLKFGLTLC